MEVSPFLVHFRDLPHEADIPAAHGLHHSHGEAIGAAELGGGLVQGPDGGAWQPVTAEQTQFVLEGIEGKGPSKLVHCWKKLK